MNNRFTHHSINSVSSTTFPMLRWYFQERGCIRMALRAEIDHFWLDYEHMEGRYMPVFTFAENWHKDDKQTDVVNKNPFDPTSPIKDTVLPIQLSWCLCGVVLEDSPYADQQLEEELPVFPSAAQRNRRRPSSSEPIHKIEKIWNGIWESPLPPTSCLLSKGDIPASRRRDWKCRFRRINRIWQHYQRIRTATLVYKNAMASLIKPRDPECIFKASDNLPHDNPELMRLLSFDDSSYSNG